jgi:singapore isolate B (sub-type 7) whole genome shotgun sequence assembly, scaffold_5
MYSSLVDNEEGRRISGVYSISGDIPDQVNAHAATLW